VTATKHRLAVYHGRRRLGRGEEYVDPTSDERLRELLKEMAEKASEEKWGRTREVRLDEWRLEVFPMRRRRRVAVVTVDEAGRTRVQR
jgi:hypothetical protein